MEARAKESVMEAVRAKREILLKQYSQLIPNFDPNLINHLKNADGDQFYLLPYNPGGHWVLIIMRPAKETVYYMDSFPNRSVDEDMRNIVNT
ncbi:unnamed protein product [Prunus armeniaca]